MLIEQDLQNMEEHYGKGILPFGVIGQSGVCNDIMALIGEVRRLRETLDKVKKALNVVENQI